MQAMLVVAETFSAPWRERNPDGTLGDEYGPKSPTAHARALAEFRLWAYRKELATRAAPPLPEDAMATIHAWLLENDAPARERQVFEMLAKGHSRRWVARELRIKRESVRVFLRRLKERVGL